MANEHRLTYHEHSLIECVDRDACPSSPRPIVVVADRVSTVSAVGLATRGFRAKKRLSRTIR